MSIEHHLQAPERLQALLEWWLRVREIPAHLQSMHYAVVHSVSCSVTRCNCQPDIVRVPGGLPA